MRRLLFPCLGLVEVIAAAALVLLGLSLPSGADVRRSFAGGERVTGAAGDQIKLLRGQVADLRRARIGPTAERLGVATRTVSAAARKSRVDFDAVRSLRDATGRAADGLDGLAVALDPEALAELGDGLGATADFLDRDVLPAAARAADDLDAASGRLRTGVRRFAEVARAASMDLKPLREMHDGLARFDEGLASLHATLDPRRLAAMREATEGAEGVVAEAARLAGRAAGYTYPVVTIDGLKPRVGTRPFWPGGAEVGVDMRKVAAGLAAMGREVEGLSKELPRIQAAVLESRKTIGATRKGLAVALARQAEVERLSADLPAQVARLAEELPRLTEDLSKALRGTERLRGLAVALRESRRGVDAAVASLPRARSGLSGSAALLRATRDQLDQAVRHRAEYEAARGQVEGLAEEFLDLLPALAHGLEARLDGEERILAEMAGGLTLVDAALPAYARAVSRSLIVGRLLAWLVAAVAGLHGLSLILASLGAGRPRPSTGTHRANDEREGGLAG